MHKYEAKKFNLPEKIEGLSQKQIEVHLGLYQGYVNHTNLLQEQLEELKKQNANPYAIAELKRRFAFEFNGMRMHEYYFDQLEHGKKEASPSLENQISKYFGSFDKFLSALKEVAGFRGIGWTIATLDKKANTMHISWVSDHELGTLAGLDIIVAIDMWEHAFMVDYVPAEKQDYVSNYLNALNWEVVEKRFN